MVLSILVDENVERVVSTALRENGYDVTLARERYGSGTVDPDLLDDALARGEVILTRDRDFAALATARDHGGILLLASADADPGTIVRGVNRLTEIHDGDDLTNQVVWRESWAWGPSPEVQSASELTRGSRSYR